MNYFIVALLVTLSFATRADEEDSTVGALEDTQKLLRDPAARQEYLKTNSKAQNVDRGVRDLAGSSANSEEIYSLSSDVAASLLAQAGNDPAKLQLLVEQAMKNPDSLASKLSPSELKRIKDVAEKIDAEKKKKP